MITKFSASFMLYRPRTKIIHLQKAVLFARFIDIFLQFWRWLQKLSSMHYHFLTKKVNWFKIDSWICIRSNIDLVTKSVLFQFLNNSYSSFVILSFFYISHCNQVFQFLGPSSKGHYKLKYYTYWWWMLHSKNNRILFFTAEVIWRKPVEAARLLAPKCRHLLFMKKLP